MPEHLADLLLSRVDKLSSESRSSSDGLGRRVTSRHRALDEVSGLAPPRSRGTLAQAIDDHVLRQRESVLEFRHGLIREAVYDDLLPDERTRTHAGFAESLQAQ